MKPAVRELFPVEPGDIVRVNGWPGTKGKRFLVKAVVPYDGPSTAGEDVPTVMAWELEAGVAARLRSFPQSCVKPVQGAAQERPHKKGN